MNLKAYAYHWTRDTNVASIQETGLRPTAGNYGHGAYLSADPLQLFENPWHEALLGVHLRGLEQHLIAVPDKKWVISTQTIPPENIFYVGNDFANHHEIKLCARAARSQYSQSNPRTRWPIRTEHIDEITRKQLRDEQLSANYQL